MESQRLSVMDRLANLEQLITKTRDEADALLPLLQDLLPGQFPGQSKRPRTEVKLKLGEAKLHPMFNINTRAPLIFYYEKGSMYSRDSRTYVIDGNEPYIGDIVELFRGIGQYELTASFQMVPMKDTGFPPYFNLFFHGWLFDNVKGAYSNGGYSYEKLIELQLTDTYNVKTAISTQGPFTDVSVHAHGDFDQQLGGIIDSLSPNNARFYVEDPSQPTYFTAIAISYKGRMQVNGEDVIVDRTRVHVAMVLINNGGVNTPLREVAHPSRPPNLKELFQRIADAENL